MDLMLNCYWKSQKIVIMMRRVTILLVITCLAYSQVFPTPNIDALDAALTSRFQNLTTSFTAVSNTTSTSSAASASTSYSVGSGQGCSVSCGWNTIDVNGAATLNVNPDVASLNLQVTGGGKTTNDAITVLSNKIGSVLSVLTSAGLNPSNWKTNYLSVYANTSYVNGTVITYGQIASQSMTITIPIPSSNGSAIGRIYDGLATVKDITINGLSFDLQDKTSSYIIARKLAYQDAVQRAKDYTNAAGVQLGAPVTITDSFSSAPVVIPGPRVAMAMAKTADVPTTVTVGTIAINYYVDVVFAFN